jgi:hypothetical protein
MTTIFDIKIKCQEIKFKNKLIQDKNSRPKTSQLRMKTIFNIKTRYKGMNLKKKLDK